MFNLSLKSPILLHVDHWQQQMNSLTVSFVMLTSTNLQYTTPEYNTE